MTVMPDEFLLYPEPIREAARNLMVRCRTGFASDVLPELADLIARAGARARAQTLGAAETMRGIIDSAYGTDAAHGLVATALAEAGWHGPITPEALAEHEPWIDPGTMRVTGCWCDTSMDGPRFNRDADGNLNKDGENVRRWAAHVLEALRG
jgi:hypothetical protein